MTRNPSSPIVPERRVAASMVGVLVAIGLSLGAQSAIAQGASPAPTGSSGLVPASSSTVPALPSVVPALPPTDPRYILARLQSEYLIEIAKGWYRVDAAPAADPATPSPAP